MSRHPQAPMRAPRLRPDLVLRREGHAVSAAVLKDPIALRYYLLGSDEAFVAGLLDGTREPAQVCEEFGRERAPRVLSADRLQAFVANLTRQGLTCVDAPDAGERLLDLHDRAGANERFATWTQPLAIRLPGFDPQRLLDAAYPLVRPLFSRWSLLACLALTLAAVFTAVANLGALAGEVTDVERLASPSGLAWLVVALGLTKVLHELGHAFTCKHCGGDCSEIGLMLLVFTPCLYCNVTDSWMLRSRWRRVAISAAGIGVELMIAAVAVLVWRYTQPGWLHTLCVNAIVVCGLGAVVFNGNPLLKYDGYYILSDLVGVPNLWQESRAHFNERLRGWFARGGRGDEPLAPPSVGLLLYASLSIAYRLAVFVAILLFLYRFLQPYGLTIVPVLVGLSVAGAAAIGTAKSVAKWVARPTSLERTRWGAVAAATLLLAGAAACFAWLGLPCRVDAPCVLRPASAERVYATTPGTLVEAARFGERVEAGETIARLENAALEREAVRLRGELDRARTRVRTLGLRPANDTAVAARLAVARDVVSDLTDQLRITTDELGRLTLASPVAGVVIQPDATPRRRLDDRELPGWTGAALDPENHGCHVERGELLCLVGDPTNFEAWVYVDETDAPYVEVGQTATLRLDASPSVILPGRVAEIAASPADEAPPEFAAGDHLPVRGGSGTPRPARTSYQVRVECDRGPANSTAVIGEVGIAKLEVEPQTVAERLRRWARRTLTVTRPTAGE